jgi:CheY-like chemotaxis protein/HPt (histidine-containing phosphotransfer) domain-containing protein
MEKVSVLLVDDDYNYRKILQQLLEAAGFAVQTAGNGIEALMHLQNQDFGVLLMDIQMPFMDGITALTEIKNIASREKPLIIACSAFFTEDQRDKLSGIGFDELLTKPIDIPELLRIVKRYDSSGNGTPKSSSILDLSLVNKLSQYGGKTSLLPLYDSFAIEAKEMLGQLDEAMSATDYESAIRLLHTLKGNAGSLGAEKVRDAAKEFESLLKENPTLDTKDFADTLTKRIFEFCESYHNLLN